MNPEMKARFDALDAKLDAILAALSAHRLEADARAQAIDLEISDVRREVQVSQAAALNTQVAVFRQGQGG